MTFAVFAAVEAEEAEATGACRALTLWGLRALFVFAAIQEPLASAVAAGLADITFDRGNAHVGIVASQTWITGQLVAFLALADGVVANAARVSELAIADEALALAIVATWLVSGARAWRRRARLF